MVLWVIIWLIGLLLFILFVYSVMQAAVDNSKMARELAELKQLILDTRATQLPQVTPDSEDLEACPGCASMVSDHAETCPECGLTLRDS